MKSMIALAGIVGSAAATQLKAVSTTRSANMTCTIPNNVSCNITSAKGIKSVLIKAGADQSYVELVDKSYNGCPKQVTVTWDSAYHAGSKQIVECSGIKLKAN